jgi:hypothetical protein
VFRWFLASIAVVDSNRRQSLGVWVSGTLRASFATLDEESIRNHILLQLNGHYDGAATGETFNSNGKTDILIRMEDIHIFIRLCKFWHGPKAFEEAIDQLPSYLTWRDWVKSYKGTKSNVGLRMKCFALLHHGKNRLHPLFSGFRLLCRFKTINNRINIRFV